MRFSAVDVSKIGRGGVHRGQGKVPLTTRLSMFRSEKKKILSKIADARLRLG